MKRILKSILPRSLIIKLWKVTIIWSWLENYRYDFIRYFKFSVTTDEKLNDKQLEARIIAHYHVLEKGLAMRDVKHRFGVDILTKLVYLLETYKKTGASLENNQYLAAVNVLLQYFKLHQEMGEDISDLLSFEKIENLKSEISNNGGVFEFDKDAYFKYSDSSFESLALSRHSVRDFSSELVNVDLVHEVMKIAQTTPSVCNRQSSKLYYYDECEQVQKILAEHTGNRGFGHNVRQLLIVASDLSSFQGVNERYQSYIDGGMYSMSILYALHSKKIAACPLNWSVEYKVDQAFRKVTDIPDCENVIMLIAIGYPPDRFKIPCSSKKQTQLN
jgi:nitroreductase